ncbi:augurin-A-like isoform X2 [Genypterus blacodes]
MELNRLLLLLVTLLLCYTHSDCSPGGKLQKLLHKPDVRGHLEPDVVAEAPTRANEFLSRLRRTKRNIWDRSRPDVQQWIAQFMHMGYDETRLETDLSYWKDQWRSSDQGRQHHYDENAPMGPPSYRQGADVNYDYY